MSDTSNTSDMSDLHVERGIVFRPDRGGKKVLAYLVGFFLLILAVNGVMIWLALGSWIGLDTDEPYDRGLRYNEEIARLEEQRALGWQVDLAFTSQAGQVGDLAVTLADAQGGTLYAATVEAEVRRPSGEGLDFRQPLTQVGADRYVAEVDFPLAGQWEIRLHVSNPDGDYRVDRRVFVEP